MRSDLSEFTFLKSDTLLEKQKQLAWNNINVVEVVSTYTEFTIILQKKQVDVSFSILMKFLAGR